jgi:hypothetical protein
MLLICLLVGLVGLLPAVQTSQPAPPATVAADPQPQAVLGETILDFGTMARGETATRTLTLENRGTAPLEISRVRNTCSCTVLEVPPSLAPGEKVELALRLDTETLNGPAQSKVNLFTNDPAAPRLDVTVRVESRAYVWAEPAEFRYSVHQHFEGDSTVRATVAGASPSEFRLTGIQSPSPFIGLSYREAREDERMPGGPGSQYVIEAKLDPLAPVGALTGWVRVSTDHEKQKKLSIPVSGFVRPMMHLTPPQADLGTVTISAEPYSWSHHLRNFATETIAVERTETDIAGLTIELQPGGHDHEMFVVLTLPADTAKGPLRGTVTLHTTSPKVPRIDLPVRGTIQ